MLGHLVYNVLLWRPGLSLLSACYRFVYDNAGAVGRFDDFVLGKLAFAAAVLPFVGRDLAAADALDVYCSDASLKGYALHRALWTRPDARAASGIEERWRFRDERALAEPPELLPAQTAAEASRRHAFDDVAGAAADDDDRRRRDADAKQQRLPRALAALHRGDHSEDALDHAEQVAADARAMDVARGGPEGGAVFYGGSSVPPLVDDTLAPHR